MRDYRNFVVLGALFVICFLGAVHGSHDNDKELLAFSIDSAKQILAAILTVTTVTAAAMNRRSSDGHNGGTNGNSKPTVDSPAAVDTSTHT